MPGGDRTGPMGMGSMTGRGAGYCAGLNSPGFASAWRGRAFGTGFGRGAGFWNRGSGIGRGRRNRFFAGGGMGFGAWGPAYANADPQSEAQALRNQAQYLRSELDGIERRLADIEAGAAKH